MVKGTKAWEKILQRKKLTPCMNSKIIECIRARDDFKKRARTNILASVMYKRSRNQAVKNDYEC